MANSKTKTPQLPLGGEATAEALPDGRTIRLTVSLKLTVPYISGHIDTGKQSARSYMMSPMISGSVDLPIDCNLFQETAGLYQRLLPCYGMLMLQEYSRVQSIDHQSPTTAPNLGLVLDARSLLATLHGPAAVTPPEDNNTRPE